MECPKSDNKQLHEGKLFFGESNGLGVLYEHFILSITLSPRQLYQHFFSYNTKQLKHFKCNDKTQISE